MGRDHELARVRALLEATREGATTALVVEGEPGIGKTTLLEAAERMTIGFRSLCVRGVECTTAKIEDLLALRPSSWAPEA
jgi:predicted ATPase